MPHRSTTNHPLEAAAEHALSTELRDAVRRVLPPEFVPSAIAFVDALPMTSGGKLDRNALPDQNPLPPPGLPQPPIGKIERSVARIYNDLLGVSSVGPHDSFFELGGHSFLVIRLIERIRRQYDVDIPLSDVFARPSVRDIASAIESQRDKMPSMQRTSSLLRIHADREYRYEPFPLTNLQRLWFAARRTPARPAGSNLYIEVEVCGEVAVLIANFQQALDRVLVLHDMLRSVIVKPGNQQVLRSVPPVDTEIIDLRRCDGTVVEAQLQNRRNLLCTVPGRADRFPLWDVVIVRLRNDRARLLARIDSLIADGSSRDIVAAHLLTFLENPRSTPPEPLCSYRDYVMSLVDNSSPRVAKRAREYWQERAAALKPSRWPPCPSTPAPRTIAGRLLSPVGWTALKGKAADTGVTPFALLLGGFIDVLLHHTALEQIVIGLMLSDRIFASNIANGVVGNFGTLVLHPVVNWGGASAAAFRELQSQLAEEIEYRHFCGLAESRKMLHGARFTPPGVPILFNSLVDLQPAVATPSLPNLSTHVHGSVIDSGAYLPGALLGVTLFEGAAGGLSCQWHYEESIFSQSSLEEIFSLYREFLNDLATRLPGTSRYESHQLAEKERL
jgi:acyl carrier protein